MSGTIILSSQAYARERPLFEDAVVVERSELIAIGHLKKGSIKYVPHHKEPSEGRSWEHHATLVVTEVIKGTFDKKKIPIIIHYGLAPKVEGRFLCPGYRMDAPDSPKDAIEIWDTGSSQRGLKPLVKDVGKDNLWFLRRRSGRCGERPGTGKFGIVDPEDIQQLSLKNYFLAYLSPDPEKAVREQLQKNPALAERAKRYLDHLEIQRILKIPDPKVRIERLLPYYIGGIHWGHESEARQGIISCGKVAGPYLRRFFDNPQHKMLRQDIIRIWGTIKYKDCVTLLINLLKEHDRFWAKQKLEKDWWNSDPNSERRRKRRNIYGEVYYAVAALKEIGDGQAKEAIELTRQRWMDINFENPQIVKECERALKVLSSEK